MMPPGHIAYTLATVQLGRRVFPRLNSVDWRFMAVAALLPDVIDKPLAILVFPEANSTQLVGHALLFNVLLLVITLLRRPNWLPYTLACNAHLAADRMWQHPATMFWPAYGWKTFFSYKYMGTPEAMAGVYWDIVTQYPQIWLIELGALAILAWLTWHYRLWRWQNLKHLLLTGRLDTLSATNQLLGSWVGTKEADAR